MPMPTTWWPAKPSLHPMKVSQCLLYKIAPIMLTYTLITVQQSFTLHIFKLHMNFRILLGTTVNNAYYC